MSCIYNGEVTDTELSTNARGGTEMMRDRLLASVKPELLQGVAIHFSRVRKIHPKFNIFYAHDLINDPENKTLQEGGWRKFNALVFVSYWQRDQYMLAFGIPHDRCHVVHNAIETPKFPIEKSKDEIRFIYHTTPHRGLELLVPIFAKLAEEYDNIHLDVFSSFKIYGWEQRDTQYLDLFETIKNHPAMTYHGTQSNDTVLEALGRSQVFLYPCIWVETSCIAMIEAMAYKNLVIHPDLGALTETQQFGSTVMYHWTPNPNDHAQTVYNTVKGLLDINKLRPGFINTLAHEGGDRLGYTAVETFASRWTDLLEKLHGRR